jgi:hypothetical protein
MAYSVEKLEKNGGLFSAESQNILNSVQHLACKLDSSSVGTVALSVEIVSYRPPPVS